MIHLSGSNMVTGRLKYRKLLWFKWQLYVGLHAALVSLFICFICLFIYLFIYLFMIEWL